MIQQQNTPPTTDQKIQDPTEASKSLVQAKQAMADMLASLQRSQQILADILAQAEEDALRISSC